jgi:hypothetical protein
MTLHISLPTNLEAQLLERAAAEGKDPAAFALEAVQEKLKSKGAVDNGRLGEERLKAWNLFAANMHAWAQGLPAGHIIDDSRDAIYEGRGE